jgi:hypothetical protein
MFAERSGTLITQGNVRTLDICGQINQERVNLTQMCLLQVLLLITLMNRSLI